MTQIILISAAPFESTESEQALKSLGFDVRTTFVGIGALTAAKNAYKLTSICANQHAVFVGSCGTFGEFAKPSLITSNSISWLPTCERTNSAYRVKDCDPTIKLESHSLVDLPSQEVICAPSISLNNVLPAHFSANSTVENLELYSVANEIDEVAKTFSIILGITNAIGKDAHQQWKSNFKTVASITADYLKQIKF